MTSMGIDNPFAVQPRSNAALRSLQVLLLAAACLAAVLAMQYGSRRWLLYRLTADLGQQPVAVQAQRLAAIADLGPMGLPVVVHQLAASDERIASAAYEVLRDHQTLWLQLDQAEGDARHRQLAETLSELASKLQDRRGAWAAVLLNQTIVETVEHPSSDADAAYRVATAALSQLRLSGPKAALAARQTAANPHDGSVRIAQQTRPLPIDLLSDGANPERWTTGNAAAVANQDAAAEDAATEAHPLDENQSPLRNVTPGSTAPLQPVPPPDDRAAADPVRQVTAPAAHLTASPFETYTPRSVIAWLRSVQPRLRTAAEQELQRRGLTQAELQLAMRLADPDVRVRLTLLDELGRRSDTQPRQWLLWLAEDAERDVRLRAIAVLGTMSDPDVHQQLAERLPEERDPAVAAQIRRVLNQR